MQITNITFSIDKAFSSEFIMILKSMTKRTKSEDCAEIAYFKIITEVDPDNENYAIQYYFANNSLQDAFESKQMIEIVNYMHERFPSKFVYFNSKLEKI